MILDWDWKLTQMVGFFWQWQAQLTLEISIPDQSDLANNKEKLMLWGWTCPFNSIARDFCEFQANTRPKWEIAFSLFDENKDGNVTIQWDDKNIFKKKSTRKVHLNTNIIYCIILIIIYTNTWDCTSNSKRPGSEESETH